jgi:hypothetical protein
MLSRIFLDSPLSYYYYSALHLSAHPLLCECELRGEFSIFSDEFVLGRHGRIIAQYSPLFKREIIHARASLR